MMGYFTYASKYFIATYLPYHDTSWSPDNQILHLCHTTIVDCDSDQLSWCGYLYTGSS